MPLRGGWEAGSAPSVTAPDGAVECAVVTCGAWPTRAAVVTGTVESVSSMRLRKGVAMAGLQPELQDQGDEGESGQQRGGREGAGAVELVVEDLDVQRQRVGEPADVARHHRHRAELAHRAR